MCFFYARLRGLSSFFFVSAKFFLDRKLLTAIFLKRCGMLFGQRDINFF